MHKMQDGLYPSTNTTTTFTTTTTTTTITTRLLLLYADDQNNPHYLKMHMDRHSHSVQSPTQTNPSPLIYFPLSTFTSAPAHSRRISIPSPHNSQSIHDPSHQKYTVTIILQSLRSVATYQPGTNRCSINVAVHAGRSGHRQNLD